MTATATLPFGEPRVGARTKLTYREEADHWIEENPELYQRFIDFARVAITSGAPRVGAKFIAERVRWETIVEKRGDWKINNNHVRRIAERLVEDVPELRGMVQFRGVRA